MFCSIRRTPSKLTLVWWKFSAPASKWVGLVGPSDAFRLLSTKK